MAEIILIFAINDSAGFHILYNPQLEAAIIDIRGQNAALRCTEIVENIWWSNGTQSIWPRCSRIKGARRVQSLAHELVVDKIYIYN